MIMMINHIPCIMNGPSTGCLHDNGNGNGNAKSEEGSTRGEINISCFSLAAFICFRFFICLPWPLDDCACFSDFLSVQCRQLVLCSQWIHCQ